MRRESWGVGQRMPCLMGLVLLVVVGSLRAQEPGFHLEGMVSRSLPVTGRKMTNVIFPVNISGGVRVSRDVLVQKVRGVENVIELKALRKDFAPTNLSVYGDDGALYSFVLHYVEDTTVLDYRVVSDSSGGLATVRLSGWPVAPEQMRKDARLLASRHGFLHCRATDDGLQLTLRGVYLCDSLLWLSLDLRDRTSMGLGVGGLRISTEDKRRVKRTATQELEIPPVYTDGIGALPGSGRLAIAVALHPFVVGHGKRLVLEVFDRVADRRVVMRVKAKRLLKARNFLTSKS